MNNYDFCVSWVKQRVTSESPVVLDYGCGAGHIVAMLRSLGVQAFGCDVFWEGGDYTANLLPDAKPYIFRMEGDRIPFDDSMFDAVISNQVLEHVPDMHVVAAELARVSKHEALGLHLFPHLGVIVEPHSRIPFLHHLPRQEWRMWYGSAYRMIKYGSRARPVMISTRRQIGFVDQWTHFRSRREILRLLADYFDVDQIEDLWLDMRVAKFPAPRAIKRITVNILAGAVIELRRH